jgi:hypothetical protein
MAAGRGAVGRDASPLAVEIARVRSTPLGAAGRERLVAEAGRIAEESAERARKRKRPEVPFWARAEFDRFFPHVLFELLGLRELVMETAWDDVGRALRLCLSSILVKFMRQGPVAPRDGAGKRIGRGVPSRFLADRAQELALGLAALERSAPAGVPAPDIAGGDARAMPDLASASFDLVLSSPPYAGTYDYAEQHEVRFRWLQMDPTRFRSIQLGERGHGFGAVPQEWHESRRRWLSEVARLLRPGAHAVLVVGDGVVGERAEDGAQATIDSSASLGLIFVASASQTRPPRDRRLAEIFAATPRREHILVLRRMS